MPAKEKEPGGTATGGRLWRVKRTGEWDKDNRIGAQKAKRIVEALRRNKNCRPMLGHLVREMVDEGRFDGPEVGFFHYIATVLSSGGKDR